MKNPKLNYDVPPELCSMPWFQAKLVCVTSGVQSDGQLTLGILFRFALGATPIELTEEDAQFLEKAIHENLASHRAAKTNSN